MTEPLVDAETVASFAALKKSARSIADVAYWFEAHPQVLPNMPEVFWPHLVMHPPRIGLITSEDKQSIMAKITLEYSARLPRESMTRLISLVHHVIDDDYNPTVSKAGGSWSICLDMREWPFVAATVACQILKDPAMASRGYMQNMLANSWAVSMPTITWQQLSTYHAAGLLPDTLGTFVRWLCDYDPKQGAFLAGDSTLTGLPNDLTY